MGSKTRAARAALLKFLVENQVERTTFIGVLDRVDAYALAAHVEACVKSAVLQHSYKDAVRGLPDGGRQTSSLASCGDDWYCPQAQQYLPTSK